MKRCVIIGGAVINNYNFVKSFLHPNDDYYIFCDSGLNHQHNLDIKPDLIIGDFDSHSKPADIHNVIVLPTVKDDTDTVYAVKEGIKRGFEDFLLIGVVGQRLDHTLVNVYSLLFLANHGKHAKIIDDYSEMEIIKSGQNISINNDYQYFSLINIAGVARGVSISGAKYNLHNASISPDFQFATSNEVLPDGNAVISIQEGFLLVIMVR